MDFWNVPEKLAKTKISRRRDVRKFGIVRSKYDGVPGRLYVPSSKGKPGDKIIFVETPEGMAFKIGDKGTHRLYIQNGGTRILVTSLPPCMNKYAPEKVRSVDVEDFKGGYLIRYDQFSK